MAKRFAWRLETVLKARYRTEEHRQQELGEAIFKLNAELAERNRIKEQQANGRRELRLRQTGRLNMADLTQINVYLGALERQHRKIEKRIADAQTIVVQKRESLAQAVRDRQILEKLKDRDYQAFRKEMRHKDQKVMDELAGRQKWQP